MGRGGFAAGEALGAVGERAVVRVAVGDDGEEAEPTDIAKARNLTLDELLTQTPGRLGTLIWSKCVVEGHEMKANQAKAHADYLSTLKAIRDRLVAEKETGK